MGGFGSAVLELLETRGLEARVKRLGLPDRTIEHGSRAEQLHEVGLTPEQVAAAVTAWLRTATHV